MQVPEQGRRRRRSGLDASWEPDSVEIFEMVAAPNYTCTTPFVNCEVVVRNDDLDQVDEMLVEATQTGAADGTLEAILQEIDLNTEIVISEGTETLPPISPQIFRPEPLLSLKIR